MTKDNIPEVVECAQCKSDIDDGSELFTDDGDVVCEHCARRCDNCDWIGTENDSFYVVNGRDDWCESCTENNAYYCEICCEYSSESSIYVRDRGEYWCSDCCCNNADYCDYCDEYYADGCENCSDERVVHDYSYRPDAIFHSTDKNERLFFGIEIEVEVVSSNYQDSATYAHRLEDLNLAYLKQDGSLNNGYEIVTHPMSHSFYMNEADELWTTLEALRTNPSVRVKSWDTRTCGLHIHISRTGFSGGAHMHRFLNLVYSNQELYESFAGRSSDRWASFDDILRNEYVRDENGNVVEDEWGIRKFIKHRDFKSKIFDGRGTNRYSAVNTQNRETLEMRIFRGSVNPYTVKSQLDLAHASVEYTRNMSVSDVINGALSAQAFVQYITANQELYVNLNDRMKRIQSPYIVGLTRQEMSN